MSWETSRRGWLRWQQEVGGSVVGQIVLRTTTERTRPAVGVELPGPQPVYVLGSLFVQPAHRGNGLGQRLITRAAIHLATLHEEVWLGLMTDNLARPPGRTRPDIRASWEGFLTEVGGADGGFVLLTPAHGLEL